MSAQFEADLDPETRWPRLRLNFANGWTVSIVMPIGQDAVSAQIASVACWPTGQSGLGKSEILATEASADEVVQMLHQVALRHVPGVVS